MTYHEEPPPLKSYGPLISWFCDITWQTKIISLPDCLWPLNFAVWNLPWWAPTHKVTCPCDHVVLQSHENHYNISTTRLPMTIKIARMVTYPDGLKPRKITLWYRNLPRWCDKLKLISTITVTVANTKLGMMVAYLEGILTIISFNALITWSCKVTWQMKTIISTTGVPMATKVSRMITYLMGF